MTSQRWSRLVSVLVFGLVLATAGSARAQWGFPGTRCRVGQPVRPGLRGRAAYGISPFECYGSFRSGRLRGPEQLHRLPAPRLCPEHRAKAYHDHVVSVGLRCRDLGPQLERFFAPGSPPSPSPTERSPRGGAAVIAVVYAIEYIKQIGTIRFIDCRPTRQLGRAWPRPPRRSPNESPNAEVRARPRVWRIVSPHAD